MGGWMEGCVAGGWMNGWVVDGLDGGQFYLLTVLIQWEGCTVCKLTLDPSPDLRVPYIGCGLTCLVVLTGSSENQVEQSTFEQPFENRGWTVKTHSKYSLNQWKVWIRQYFKNLFSPFEYMPLQELIANSIFSSRGPPGPASMNKKKNLVISSLICIQTISIPKVFNPVPRRVALAFLF
jgi:hypothetical protein